MGDIHTASLFRNDSIYNVASIQVPPRPPQSSQPPWMWSLHWLHVFPITHQLQAIIRGEGDPAKYYFEELHLTIEPSNPFGGCVGRNCHHVSWYTALCKRRDPASIVPEALCNSYLQLELGHSPTRIPQWPMIYLFSHLVKGGGGAASDVYVGLRSKCGLWTSLPDPGASTRRMAFKYTLGRLSTQRNRSEFLSHLYSCPRNERIENNVLHNYPITPISAKTQHKKDGRTLQYISTYDINLAYFGMFIRPWSYANSDLLQDQILWMNGEFSALNARSGYEWAPAIFSSK